MFRLGGPYANPLKCGILFLLVIILSLPLQQLVPDGTTLGKGAPLGQKPKLDTRTAEKKKFDETKAKRAANVEKRKKDLADAREKNFHRQKLDAPLWRMGDGFQTTIVISNTMTREVSVFPSVYTASGKLLPTNSVTVPKLGSISVLLSELISLSGRTPESGQISLHYVGEEMEINAHLLVVNSERSLSLDHPFETAADFSSTQFEGLFYAPTSSIRAELALSNSGDKPILARFAVHSEGFEKRKPRENSVLVAPHHTELVDLRSLLGASADPLASRLEPVYPLAVRVTIAHVGDPGDLRFQGYVIDKNGYSANIRIMETSALKGTKLMSGLPPLPESVNSIVLLSNSGEKDSEVELEAYYTVDGDVRESEFRDVTVPAKSAIHYDLTADLANLPMGASNLALVLHPNRDGVLADLLQIDSSASGVYQLTPKGYYGHEHGVHSFPVRIGDSVNTIITVANPSESAPMTYSMNFFYDGGIYTHDGSSLKPGEVLHIDLRILRDNHVPGRKQKFIPSSVKEGQVKVSFINPSPPKADKTPATDHRHQQEQTPGYEQEHIPTYASALIFDTREKLSFTTCMPACPPAVVDFEIDGSDIIEGELRDGGFNNFSGIHFWFDDSTDEVVSMEATGYTWAFAGYNVAYGNSNSIEFTGVGEKMLTAYIFSPFCVSFPSFGDYCLACYFENPTINLYVIVADSPRIFMGETDITGSETEVIVGQRISLSFTTIGTATNPVWTVPNTKTGGWTDGGSPAFAATSNPSAILNQATTTFYWVDGGSKTVTLNVTVGGQTQTATASFNVAAPSGNMTVNPGGADRIDKLTATKVGYGDVNGTVGITFANNYSKPGGNGSFQWVQVMNNTVQVVHRVATNQDYTNAPCSGRDRYPYPDGTSTTTNDSPNVDMRGTGVSSWSRTDSFTMTLMYKPSTTGSIWVPIANVAWGWGYTATSSNGGSSWTITSKTPPVTPPDTLSPGPTTAFPVWDRVVGVVTTTPQNCGFHVVP